MNKQPDIELLAYLTTPVVVLDTQCRLYNMNQAAEELLEVSNRRFQHYPLRDFLRNHESILESIDSVATFGAPVIVRKAELVLLNGSKQIVDYTVSIIENGSEPWFVLELHEFNRSSLSFSRKEAMLNSHEASVELIRSLGHEIKNPLGGIRGAAQLLASELQDPELKDYTHVIINETDRLVKLIDRMAGGRERPEISSVNLHEVLERVRSLIEAESKGSITIHRDYDPSLPETLGDLEQLIQALLNIVRNALQALTENPFPQSKPEIILRTRALTNATITSQIHRVVLRIEVIDNGPGISEELMEQIFYPLISGRPEGTGLGLSIAQNILKQHEGLIECDSKPGQTRFTLSIPYKPEAK